MSSHAVQTVIAWIVSSVIGLTAAFVLGVVLGQVLALRLHSDATNDVASAPGARAINLFAPIIQLPSPR